jgi:hypothetical protein
MQVARNWAAQNQELSDAEMKKQLMRGMGKILK